MPKIPPIMLGICLIVTICLAGALALTSHKIPSQLWAVIYILIGGTAVASPTSATQALIASKTAERK